MNEVNNRQLDCQYLYVLLIKNPDACIDNKGEVCIARYPNPTGKKVMLNIKTATHRGMVIDPTSPLARMAEDVARICGSAWPVVFNN